MWGLALSLEGPSTPGLIRARRLGVPFKGGRSRAGPREITFGHAHRANHGGGTRMVTPHQRGVQ